MRERLFYLQDSREYVGNDVLWWAKDGKGYTTDLSKAAVYSREAAQRMHVSRGSDVPWPKSYIDGKARPAVDMQHINRDEALAGTGIVLTPGPKPKKVADQIEQRLRTLGQPGLSLMLGAGWQHIGPDEDIAIQAGEPADLTLCASCRTGFLEWLEDV
jgi:hypothetical protein